MKLHWNYCTLKLLHFTIVCISTSMLVWVQVCVSLHMYTRTGGWRPIRGIIPLVTWDRVCHWPWYIYLGWLSSRTQGPACISCPSSRTVNTRHPWLLHIGSRDPAHVLLLARHMTSMPPAELSSQPPLFTKRCKIFIVNQLILGGQISDTIS